MNRTAEAYPSSSGPSGRRAPIRACRGGISNPSTCHRRPFGYERYSASSVVNSGRPTGPVGRRFEPHGSLTTPVDWVRRSWHLNGLAEAWPVAQYQRSGERSGVASLVCFLPGEQTYNLFGRSAMDAVFGFDAIRFLRRARTARRRVRGRESAGNLRESEASMPTGTATPATFSFRPSVLRPLRQGLHGHARQRQRRPLPLLWVGWSASLVALGS